MLSVAQYAEGDYLTRQVPLREKIRINLIRLLERDRIKPADLARRIKVSPSAVSHWIKGDDAPKLNHIDAMCESFGWAHEELIPGSGDRLAEFIRMHNESESPFSIGLRGAPKRPVKNS